MPSWSFNSAHVSADLRALENHPGMPFFPKTVRLDKRPREKIVKDCAPKPARDCIGGTWVSTVNGTSALTRPCILCTTHQEEQDFSLSSRWSLGGYALETCLNSTAQMTFDGNKYRIQRPI